MDSKVYDKEPSTESLQSQLVGTWRLMSAEDLDPATGKWIPYTFGNPPSGYFIYDATGHASIQIMTTPPVKIATPDSPTPVEALEIFNGYIAYYGTYTVDAENIHHQVEGAWDPSQVGSDQVRPYELCGDTLIIGDQKTYKRTLERVR
jgi:Lipocalin-like domain